jgi:hypothetical protein
MAHAHEIAVGRVEPPLSEVAAAAQQDQVAGLLADLEVDQDETVHTGLRDPGPPHGRDRAGRDDPVVGGVLREAAPAVGGHDRGVVAEAGQPFPSQPDQLGLDIHSEDVLIAEPVAQQRGVQTPVCGSMV